MRRTAIFPAAYTLAATLLLAGCGTLASSPADGLGGFLVDVFSWRGAPNRPAIDSPNARRITGTAEEVEPLQTEPGNVWPGPLPPPPTPNSMPAPAATGPSTGSAATARGSPRWVAPGIWS